MVTQEELTVLRQAKLANPHWFKAIIYCARIMASRRKKYSGDKHSYFNFFDMAKRTGLSIWQVFLFFVNIKLSRLGVGSIEELTVIHREVLSDGRKAVTARFIAYDEERDDTEFTDDPKKDSWADAVNYPALALGAILDMLTQKDVDEYIPVNPDEHPYEWPTLLLDFDGVLNMYDGWNGYFEHFDPRPGAVEFLKEMKARGFHIVIHTVRPDIEATWAWLEEHGMKEYIIDITNIKPAGVVLLDDRAITFSGSFDKAQRDITNFRAHWEVSSGVIVPMSTTRKIMAGLDILHGYEGDNLMFEPGHDVVYAGETLPIAMIAADANRLSALGWQWDENLECWYHFT